MAGLAQAKGTRARLIESGSADPQRIDRANGVIRGVRVLGKVSKNGREYSDRAMADAVRLYEGASVFIDHPDRSKANAERTIRDKFGFLRNARVEGDAVRADLHYMKSHSEAGFILEMAERNPKMLGLSHNAEGRMGTKGGKRVVEGLESVRSVDIVSSPATNEGLFESVTLREEDAMAPIATIGGGDLSGKTFGNSWKAIKEGFAVDAANIVISTVKRKEKEKKLAELLDAYEAAEAVLNKAEDVNTVPGPMGIEKEASLDEYGKPTLAAKLKMRESLGGGSGASLMAGKFMTHDGRFSRSANDDRDDAKLANFWRRNEPQQLTEEQQQAEAEQAKKDQLKAFAKAVKG